VKRSIIIGYDGSPNSEDALVLGKQLCEALDATPLVASCVLFPRYLMDPPELGLAVEEDTKPLFDAAIGRLAPLTAQTCSLYASSAALGIQELAEDVRPVMIVVGSAHRGRIGRVFLGSTGKSVLTGSPTAVAVAPRGYSEREGERLLRVGAALDDGEEATRALDAAIGLAERLHASLTIVGVLSANPVGYGTMAGAAVGDLVTAQRKHFAEVLEDAAARVPQSLPVTVRRLAGPPADKLAQISNDFDLMLLGSRGYGPLRRVLLGSVSARLMDSAACPLLITPRSAGADPVGVAAMRGHTAAA
jgi:nucleotide-binding universal stress UspA family protein